MLSTSVTSSNRTFMELKLGIRYNDYLKFVF